MKKTALLLSSLMLLCGSGQAAALRQSKDTAPAAQELAAAQEAALRQAYADSVAGVYAEALERLCDSQASAKAEASMPSPYYFRLFGPGTLWNSALTRHMGPAALDTQDGGPQLPALGSSADPQLELAAAIDGQLARAYVEQPQLFAATQEQMMSQSRLRSELSAKVQPEARLATKVQEAAPAVEAEAVEVIVAKPNFWTFKGNGGLQFTQSYFSKNWYQGGEKNYSMLGLLSFDANYDNKRRVQLDNKLEAQLGFQTSETATPKFRPTSNLLRLTSNLGIKAIGNWNYSAQLQLQTQPYISYNGSSRDVVGDFISPLYVRSSLGMDYNIKKKRFTGKVHLAPVSYVITYVERKGLVTRYGINPGHHSKHEWGPNVDFTFDYKIAKNISWHSRLYWFSNFKLTRIENEHTFNFTVNKYVSAKVFLYPRFEDVKYYGGEDARHTYWMFKEFLSLGLNYDF